MLKWIARAQLDKFERAFDYDVSYMREMLDTSRRGFMRFSPVAKMAAYREDVPVDAWYAAKIVALLVEDCGPCTQLVVRMAEADGVSQAVLRSVLLNDEKGMGNDVALSVRFARAVLAHDAGADALRTEIAARWGARAVLSLALAIAASRVFPTVKYALGHGMACSRVRVGDVDMRPAAAPA
ncbi:MAG TPA: hypothetical protein VEC06_13925 [Paucimonas sp.]|nr:hypothetical protein [Paucimonas sp.]